MHERRVILVLFKGVDIVSKTSHDLLGYEFFCTNMSLIAGLVWMMPSLSAEALGSR